MENDSPTEANLLESLLAADKRTVMTAAGILRRLIEMLRGGGHYLFVSAQPIDTLVASSLFDAALTPGPDRPRMEVFSMDGVSPPLSHGAIFAIERRFLDAAKITEALRDRGARSPAKLAHLGISFLGRGPHYLRAVPWLIEQLSPDTILVGDPVTVTDPKHSDSLHLHAFLGTVVRIDRGPAGAFYTVADQDGEEWVVEEDEVGGPKKFKEKS